MAYQVLARKWRPKKFNDLVGQEHVIKALVNALDKGRLHHAYLLTGTRGVGKTTIARILAKSLNCPHVSHGEPCGVCDSCIQIDNGRYVDLLEIDAASNTGIDNIREVLENAQYAPTMGRYKVYIIDEVHMLSKSAFNAMLKTLEEPPEHVKFILATTDPHKVPITVLSRCLQFVLRNLNVQQVHEHLAYVLRCEAIAFEDAALQLLARAAMGSMRDALSLLDQAIAMGSGAVTEADVRQMIGAVDKSYLYDLLQALADKNGQALMDKAADMAGRAIGFDNALSELALLLQKLALLQTVPSAVSADDPEYAALTAFAQALPAELIQLYYQCAIRGKQDLTLAPDEYAGFVMTLLRMLAFAPMAAAQHPQQGQISGSALHDPPAPPIGAAVPTPTPPADALSPSAATSGQAAAVDDGNEPTAQDTDAEQMTVNEDDVPPWQALPDHASAMPASAVALKRADQPAPEADPVQPPPLAAPELATPENSAGEQDQQADSAPVRSNEALPVLNADNWMRVVAILAQPLGAVQLFAQHTAVVDFDEHCGVLQLALASAGEVTADKARLGRLAEVLSHAYARPIQVRVEAWQQESGLETHAMRREREQQEARQTAEQILDADSTAQELKATFAAQWLSTSLQLKDSTA